MCSDQPEETGINPCNHIRQGLVPEQFERQSRHNAMRSCEHKPVTDKSAPTEVVQLRRCRPAHSLCSLPLKLSLTNADNLKVLGQGDTLVESPQGGVVGKACILCILAVDNERVPGRHNHCEPQDCTVIMAWEAGISNFVQCDSNPYLT